MQAEATTKVAEESIAPDIVKAIAVINQMANDFMQNASQVLAVVQAQAVQPPPPKPRLKAMELRREGGKVSAVPVYDDEPALN